MYKNTASEKRLKTTEQSGIVTTTALSRGFYGVRDFVASQRMLLFLLCNMLLLKMVSQTKLTEDTPYFKSKWKN